MERILPWAELLKVIEPVYPKISEAGGRPPIPLERMLRIYFLQLWFNLSDPAVEEAMYDSTSMRGFVGIDLGVEAAPDETTVCKFRHLLEKNKLGKKLLKTVNEYLRRHGMRIANGTIVDATIIGAPSSRKNKDGKRDPEIHQTAKGKQWFFGMNAHVQDFGLMCIIRVCKQRFAEYEADKSAGALEALGVAYLAVPRHLRRFCGDMTLVTLRSALCSVPTPETFNDGRKMVMECI